MDRKAGRKLFDFVIECLAFIAGVLLLLVTLFVSYAVVMRYLHFRPPIWVLQFTEYALLWITFLGAAWLLREGGHIKIDTIISRFNPKGLRTAEIIDDILGFIVCFTIFLFGTLHTIDLYQRGIMDVKGVTVPKFVLFLIIPLGGLILLIQFGRHFLEYFRSKP
jgi:C4-dicarboxylate transporter DctQ subunit